MLADGMVHDRGAPLADLADEREVVDGPASPTQRVRRLDGKKAGGLAGGGYRRAAASVGLFFRRPRRRLLQRLTTLQYYSSTRTCTSVLMLL